MDPHDCAQMEQPVVSTFDIERREEDKSAIHEDVQETDEAYILGDRDQERWVRYARAVSYVSIVFTLVGGVIGIIMSFLTDSVALLGYGLESFVDVWSSVLVLWRFWHTAGQHQQQQQSEMQMKHTAFNKREQQASFGIAITFILIGLFVGIQATVHLAAKEEPSNAEALLAISAISAVFLSVLAAVKFKISHELDSPALYKDGMSSAAVAVLSFGILLSAAIYDANSSVWWLDNVVAFLIAVFLVLYGTISTIKRRK